MLFCTIYCQAILCEIVDVGTFVFWQIVQCILVQFFLTLLVLFCSLVFRHFSFRQRKAADQVVPLILPEHEWFVVLYCALVLFFQVQYILVFYYIHVPFFRVSCTILSDIISFSTVLYSSTIIFCVVLYFSAPMHSGNILSGIFSFLARCWAVLVRPYYIFRHCIFWSYSFIDYGHIPFQVMVIFCYRLWSILYTG